jgi:hypothetical protein
MIISHWSNSALAVYIRKLFRIAPQPTSATHEEWIEYRKTSKKSSPVGVLLIETLDKIQNLIYYAPEKIESIFYYIFNVSRSSHVLRTKTKFGHYSDLVEQIPAALMLSIIDFVEIECFDACTRYDSDIIDPIIVDYNKQSTFKRRFFPMGVSPEVRAQYAYKWLDYQTNFQKELSENIDEVFPYEEIKKVYEFAKTRYVTFDPYKEAGIGDGFEFMPRDPEKKKAQHEAFNKVTELENEFNKELLLNMERVVKYREYLWT